MSKDKYRPSVADFEVVKTEVERRTIDPAAGDGRGISTGGGGDDTLVSIPEQPIDEIGSNWYPKNLRVVSQTVKYNEQGMMRVDVTLEWDELDGASGYHVRVAEVGRAG